MWLHTERIRIYIFNKFQVLLDKNNCIECNDIYYCIYVIVKEDKANAVVGYLERINMMHYRK